MPITLVSTYIRAASGNGVKFWAEIHDLRSKNMSMSQIARELGISRNTVRTALSADVEPRYTRAPRGSIVDAAEPQIRDLLALTPDLPATRIAEKIGWTHSIRILSGKVAQLRPEYLGDGAPTASARTTAHVGLWLPSTQVPVGSDQIRTRTQLPVLMIMLDRSTLLRAQLLPTQRAEDLFAGAYELLTALGAVPSVLIWSAHAAVATGSAENQQLTDLATRFAGATGTQIVAAHRTHAEHRLAVTRTREQLHRMFLPGRRFLSPEDFNDQLNSWLRMFNAQPRSQLGGDTPASAATTEMADMAALPIEPVDLDWHLETRVGRPSVITFDGNRYGVPHELRGRDVTVVADLRRVRVFDGARRVAEHQRSWARDQLVELDDHSD